MALWLGESGFRFRVDRSHLLHSFSFSLYLPSFSCFPFLFLIFGEELLERELWRRVVGEGLVQKIEEGEERDAVMGRLVPRKEKSDA